MEEGANLRDLVCTRTIDPRARTRIHPIGPGTRKTPSSEAPRAVRAKVVGAFQSMPSAAVTVNDMAFRIEDGN